MLTIYVPLTDELWDEENEEFIPPKLFELELEHSLVSISRWESKWLKPFLTEREKTTEEIMHYIKCMTMTPKVDPVVYTFLTEDNIREINDYINAPMTATTVSDNGPKRGRSRIVTSELIYAWMVALNIPHEFENWHINRLLMLIRVINAENNPPKARSSSEIMKSNAALNAARRAKYHSKG